MAKNVLTINGSADGDYQFIISSVPGATITISEDGGSARSIAESVANPGFFFYKGIKLFSTYSISQTLNGKITTKTKRVDNLANYTISMPVLLDATYFNSNGRFFNSSGSHNVITNCHDNTDGLEFVGRDTTCGYPTKIRWEVDIDCNKYQSVTYQYCRYNIHGNHGVYLSDSTWENNTSPNIIASNTGTYGNYTVGTWYNFTLDFKGAVGIKKLIFYGGYADHTGDANSKTRYANIVLN